MKTVYGPREKIFNDTMHAPTATQSGVAAAGNASAVDCPLPYDEGRVPLLLLYSVVLFIGLPANLATVYLTWVQVRRKNVLGVYLWSLSVCDLTYLCTLPLWAHYVSSRHRWPWSAAACKLTGFLFFTNMYVSIFLLVCVSVDRYVAVAYAVESRGVRRQRLAVAIAAGIVLVVAGGHVPVFAMPEGDADRGERRCFEPSQSTATVTGFNYARFVIGFSAPLAVLVATNRAILATVRASTGLAPRQKERVRYLALAVVALFLVCFAPYHVILLLRAVTFHVPALEKCLFEQRVYTAYTISLGLSTFNSAMNPLLYVLSSDNVRKEISQALADLGRRATLRPRSTDSSQHQMHASKNSSEAAATASRVEEATAGDGSTVCECTLDNSGGISLGLMLNTQTMGVADMQPSRS